MTDHNSLPERMHALADTGHARAAELRTQADALNAAIDGALATPETCSVPKLLGTWAKARRLWCDITGESLI